MKLSQDNFFWPSFSDLMTALFFVMLVLYVLTFVKLKRDQGEFRVAAEKYEKLQEIEKSMSNLDKEYFDYDPNNKRFRMTADVLFKPGSDDISLITAEEKLNLMKTGRELFTFIRDLEIENPEIQYLIVLEGNTTRHNNNFKTIPNTGYSLSYMRALALYNFWKERGYDFKKLKTTELLIAGSGYFGKSRDTIDEYKNKRFTIQITGKLGEFK